MEKYVIAQYLNTFDVISETFKATHRIKILDFDICNKYIVFGASSGGIYVFKRFPCELIKFIPSTEGSTLHVKISVDELHLALANSKGLVVILENFFGDLIIRPHVQNDHEGNIVTVIHWYGNELYIGDNIGKVSIFTLEKAFFQNPSAVLLKLDSPVTQIDNYQSHFLVSTKTRTYLCDGKKGQYKQIGKKIRNSNNGACFCKDTWSESLTSSLSSREMFKTAEDNGEFTSVTKDNITKIFCARPKGRLWEVDFETTVLQTYNFRNLPLSDTEILLIDDSQDSSLKIMKDDITAALSLNFNNVYAISNRFVVTYDTDSVNIVDPITSSLVFSKHNFKNLIGIRVLGTFIFILTSDFKMIVIALQNLEELIVNTLLNKQYYLSAEMCLYFKHDLIGCIEKLPRLSLLLILKTKLLGKNNTLNELKPIFASLESCYKKTSSRINLEGQIATVDNGYEYVEDAIFLSNNSLDQKDIIEEEVPHVGMKKNKIYCIYRQYNLTKFQPHAELSEYRNIVENMTIDEILILMEDFMKYVQDIEIINVMRWIQMEVTKLASTRISDLQSLQPKTLTFLTESFLKINSSKDLNCKCSFPLPIAHKQKIDHYNLGINLFNLLNDKKYYLNTIPFFYKHYLKEIDNVNIVNCLRLIVQLSDLIVLKEMKPKLTYDNWEEILQLFIQLKQGKCLNCSENLDLDSIWSWNELGLVMVRLLGPKNTIRLLKRYSTYISKGELSPVFFNGCIMAMAYEGCPHVMDVVEQHFSNCDQLNMLMEHYLEKQYIDQISAKVIKVEVNEMQKCSYCGLSLNGPILNQYKKCICGNSFHHLCSIGKDNNLCNDCLAKRFLS